MIIERVGSQGEFCSRTVGTLQETRDALAMVQTRVLLFLAERLGPAIDRVEPSETAMETRDLVITLVEQQVGSPAEVRAALLDLIEMGYACATGDGDVTSMHSRVGLLPHGLVAARIVQPDVSKPRTLRLVLPSRKNAPEFFAKFDTGRPDFDKQLNKSALALACFYLLCIEHPTMKNAVTLDWFAERMPCFAVMGLGPKSGRGTRLEVQKETISETLQLLQASLLDILPLQENKKDEGAGPLPRPPRRRRRSASPDSIIRSV